MGKALKTAGAIIGGAVLIATGVGALAGVNVAAMGVASFTGSMTVGQLGLISSGLSAVGGMLDKPKSSGAAAPTEWTANEDQPTPFAFGRIGVAGKIVHWDEYGQDNKLKSFVSVFSGAGPIKSFVSFKAGDLPVSFVSNGSTAIGKYNRQMWRSWKVGTQPDTALPRPTGLDGGASMPQWGAAYRLSGKACDLWTLQQDSKLSVYPGNAEPKPLTVLEGVFGYDHRYDSSYPGGFGDCRLNDRSTWRWISNPIIAALNWALGMKENGQVVGGIGASPDGIDYPAFAECANIAEANAWEVSAWPDTSQDASVVLDQFLQAGGAVRARHAGKISCVSRGAPRASIVTITRRDTAGAIELDTGASAFNRLNTITPRFMSEARGWKLWPADPVTFAAYRTEDGGKRGDKVDYPFVPKVNQAAQLAAYDILDAREPFSGTIPLKPHLRRLKPGDCFDIDEPGFLLDGVKCMVLSRSYDPSSGEVRIAFRSETDGKHDLALGKTTTLPTYPVLTPADPNFVSPPVAGDWAATVREPSEGGSQLAVFDVVGSVGNATATGLLIWLSETGADPWKLAWSGPPTATNIPVTGMQPGVSYFVGISYQRGQNESTRLILGPLDTPELVALTAEESEALERLAKIESDNWLTKGEKPDVIEKWNTVFSERPGIEGALTAAGLTSTLTTYSNAANALGSFLSGLDPAWNDLTEDTPLVGASLRNLFASYFVAKQLANQALAESAIVDANEALAAITVIGSDAWLSKGEKPAVKRELDVFLSDYPALEAQALVLGVTTPLTAHASAVNTLRDYLQGLSPGYADVTTDTAVVPATFAARFVAAHTTKQTLLNAFALAINTTATTAQADAAAAIGRITAITSDAVLSRDEKPGLIRDWQVIIAEFPGYRDQALAIGANAARTALIDAYSALSAYLAALAPAYNDLTQDTPIVPSTFGARFQAYYVAKAAVVTAMIGLVQEDANVAQDAIARIASDNWLTAGEKPEVIRQRSVFLADYPGLEARATALGLSTALAAHGNAVNAMRDYLDGLSPAWNNLSADTAIVGTTLRTLFTNAYTTKQSLENAISAAIGADAGAALSRLDIIAADGWLSRNEKPRVIQDYAVVVGEYVDLINKGNAAGATTQVSAYSTAITNLNNYLFGLSPAWDNLSFDSAISGPTFRSRWADYYATKTALQTAISTAAGGAPLRITASSRGIARNVAAAGTYTTASITFTISGGSGNYAWEFFLLPASSNGPNAVSASISGTSGTGASAGTTFTATVASGETVFGSFGFEARDTATGAKTTSLHTGRIVNTA